MLFSCREILFQLSLEVFQCTGHCTLQKFSFGVMSHTPLVLKNAFLGIWRKASSYAGLAASSEAPVLVLSSNPSLLPQMRQGRKWVYNYVFCRHSEACASDNHKKSCLLRWFQKAVYTQRKVRKAEVSVVISGIDEEQMISFPHESNPLWSPDRLAKGLWQWPSPVSTSDSAGLVLAPPCFLQNLGYNKTLLVCPDEV